MLLLFATELEFCKYRIISVFITANKPVKQKWPVLWPSNWNLEQCNYSSLVSEVAMRRSWVFSLMFHKGNPTVGALVKFFPFPATILENLICFTLCQTWQKSFCEFRSYCDQSLTDKFHFLRKQG